MAETKGLRPNLDSPDTSRAAPSALGNRSEVCPPSLGHASSGGWRGMIFGWLMRSPATGGLLERSGLEAVREDFLASIDDLDSRDVEHLRRQIESARSLRELWHLRAAVYRVVAVSLSQSHAEARLAGLDGHFPSRVSRPGLVSRP